MPIQTILVPGYLYWDGHKYILVPGIATTPSGPAGGDLGGTYPDPTVVGIRGNSVPVPGGTNTVLTWTGSALAWNVASGGSFTPADDLSGNNTSTTTNQYVSSLSYSSSASGGAIGINGTATSLVWAATNTGPSISQASTTGAGVNFSISAQNTTVSTQNAGNLNIFGGSNTAAQNGDDGGAGADVNITAGTTNQVGGGGGDVNISGGRNLAVGGGGGAIPASLTLPGGYANGEDAILTMASNGDSGSRNFLLNDPFGNTWFSVNGTVNNIVLAPEGTTNVTATFGKFAFNQGWRRHVTSISSGATYTIDTFPTWDDYVAITTLTAPFQINLPSVGALGNTYEIKDTVGAAATFPVTISGNGNNIDGASSYTLTFNYEAIVVTWTGTQWSIT
jgi:hypothetical protein